MTFWQENYPFIKDVYVMRQTKMVEWMENVEKAIARIMADKVYTSAEFKRERDNFHVSEHKSYDEVTLMMTCFIHNFHRPCAKTWNEPRLRNGSNKSWKSSWPSVERKNDPSKARSWTS